LSYQLVTCPVCHREVQADIRRNDPTLYVGLHTPLDGTGVMCKGTGRAILTQQQESHHGTR
jgi:hypothetical protein